MYKRNLLEFFSNISFRARGSYCRYRFLPITSDELRHFSAKRQPISTCKGSLYRDIFILSSFLFIFPHFSFFFFLLSFIFGKENLDHFSFFLKGEVLDGKQAHTQKKKEKKVVKVINFLSEKQKSEGVSE